MNAAAHAFRFERRPVARTLEFVAYCWPLDAAAFSGWPLEAGSVRRDAQQQPSLLHFAAGRWLVADAGAEQQQALLEAAAGNAAGVVVDVTGKWCGLELTGPGATALLAFSIDVAAVLDGRECAAVTLMDCPAIVARSVAGYHLWVQASHVDHFLETAQQCGATLRREP